MLLKKKDSWLPFARRDMQKIRNAYVGAQADRLYWLWTLLVSLANRFNRESFTRLALKMCGSKRQTTKATRCSGVYKMVEVSRPARGTDGKYKHSVITFRPSAPCTNSQQMEMDNHLRNKGHIALLHSGG